MEDKQKILVQHKKIATALLVLMILVFVLMLYLQSIGLNNSWIEGFKAFAEAAMIGALADWFAVVAIFRKPLGLPIAHTNLIETHKDDIGANLGGFVVDNFFTHKQIRPYVSQIKATEMLGDFLRNDKNKYLIIRYLQVELLNFCRQLDKKKVLSYIEKELLQFADEINIQKLLGDGAKQLIVEGKHQKAFDFLLEKINLYLQEYKTEIGNRVTAKFEKLPLIGALVGGFGGVIGEGIVKGITNFISEVQENNQHPIRKRVDEETQCLVAAFSTSKKWQYSLNEITTVTINQNSTEIAENIFLKVQKRLINNLQDENSDIMQQILKILDKTADEIKNNKHLNAWVQKKTYKFVLKNKIEVKKLITQTVSNWNAKALSKKMELEVGKDLQFIRINGTLVGGSIGLLIHMVSKLLF